MLEQLQPLLATGEALSTGTIPAPRDQIQERKSAHQNDTRSHSVTTRFSHFYYAYLRGFSETLDLVPYGELPMSQYLVY